MEYIIISALTVQDPLPLCFSPYCMVVCTISFTQPVPIFYCGFEQPLVLPGGYSVSHYCHYLEIINDLSYVRDVGLLLTQVGSLGDL